MVSNSNEIIKIYQRENEVRELIYRLASEWSGTPVVDFESFRAASNLKNSLPRIFYPQRNFLAEATPPEERLLMAAITQSRPEIVEVANELDKYIAASESLIKLFSNGSRVNQYELESLIKSAKRLSKREKTKPTSVEANVIEALGATTACHTALEMVLDGIVSLKNLKARQLATYPKGPGRPRIEKHYAVARELAEIYNLMTGETPTFSQSGALLHGRFTPALRCVFDTLGWNEIDLSGPAEAAVAKFKSTDK